VTIVVTEDGTLHITEIDNSTSPATTTTQTLTKGSVVSVDEDGNVTVDEDAEVGECGSAQGQIFTSTPTQNLCDSGSVSNITDDGNNFNWICFGSGGGANANCSAIYENNTSDDTNSTDESETVEFKSNQDGTKSLIFDSNIWDTPTTITVPQDKDMQITQNSDGSTIVSSDEPKVDIAINEDGSLTAEQIFDDGDVNRVEIDIVNSDINIQEDNSIVIKSNTKNDDYEDVNITTTLREDGSIVIASKVADNNTTVISIDEPGSTIQIDSNGKITIDSEKEFAEESKIVALHLVIDGNSGAINGSLIHKDSSTQEISKTQDIQKVAGTVLKVTNFKIQEVTATLDDNRKVEVIISDENNTTIKSTTTISADLDVTRTSLGEDGKITSQITLGEDTTIVVDNFLDGKAKHSVKVGTQTTEATSNLEGADVNVTAEGVTTTFVDATQSITAEVKATNEGFAEHKMTIASGSITEAKSEILGAKTVIDNDEDGNPKIVTRVSTINSDSQSVDIEVEADSNGRATHIVTTPNGVSRAVSKLAGAKTLIDTSGNVNTSVDTNITKNSRKFEAVAITDAHGETETKFREVDGETEHNSEPTLATGEKFPVGSQVEISEDDNNIIHIQTTTPVLTQPTVFTIQ